MSYGARVELGAVGRARAAAGKVLRGALPEAAVGGAVPVDDAAVAAYADGATGAAAPRQPDERRRRGGLFARVEQLGPAAVQDSLARRLDAAAHPRQHREIADGWRGPAAPVVVALVHAPAVSLHREAHRSGKVATVLPLTKLCVHARRVYVLYVYVRPRLPKSLLRTLYGFTVTHAGPLHFLRAPARIRDNSFSRFALIAEPQLLF